MVQAESMPTKILPLPPGSILTLPPAQQAKAIEKALIRKRPELQSTFQKNYAKLEEEFQALDREIQAIVSKAPSTPLLVSHPVYDYFARRYGLNIKSVHWEPDQVPGDVQWRELKEILEKHPAKTMIWEGEPVTTSVDKLKSLGINSLVFDPCGTTTEQDDFMTVMEQNLKNLKLAF